MKNIARKPFSHSHPFRIQQVSAALGKMFKTKVATVRAAAAFSIGQIRSSLAEPFLVESLKTEKEKSVREELTRSIRKSYKAMGSFIDDK